MKQAQKPVRHLNQLISSYLENPSDEKADLLVAAVMDAEWGQNGASFVTDCRYSWGRSDRLRTLYINGRERVSVWYYDDDAALEYVLAIDKAEKEWASRRQERRERQAAYDRERTLLIQRLQQYGVARSRSFAHYEFCDGQEGGTFKNTYTGQHVAAYGALVGAWGEGFENQDDVLYGHFEEEWDRKVYNARF